MPQAKEHLGKVSLSNYQSRRAFGAATHRVPAQAAEALVNVTPGDAAAFGTTRRETGDASWLDLAVVADVAVIVGGRREPRVPGLWSASAPGEQTIEIRFHDRTPVRRLRVVSSEVKQSRTQQMTIWVSLRGGERHRELLRQQFNFSPNGATEEVEDYVLELEDVSTIQLRIVPSIDGRAAIARVDELRVASVNLLDK